MTLLQAEDEDLHSLVGFITRSRYTLFHGLILEADLRSSKFDELSKAVGNSLYARVFQCWPVGIVMCRGISITDRKWYPATVREHACAEDGNLRPIIRELRRTAVMYSE